MQDTDVLNQDTTVSAQWQSAEPDVTHGRVNGYLTMSIDCETDLDEPSYYFFEWHITDFNTSSQAALAEAGVVAEFAVWDTIDRQIPVASVDTNTDARLAIPATGAVVVRYNQSANYLPEICPDKGGSSDANFYPEDKFIFRFRKPDNTVLFQSVINLSAFKPAQLTRIDDLEFSW